MEFKYTPHTATSSHNSWLLQPTNAQTNMAAHSKTAAESSSKSLFHLAQNHLHLPLQNLIDLAQQPPQHIQTLPILPHKPHMPRSAWHAILHRQRIMPGQAIHPRGTIRDPSAEGSFHGVLLLLFGSYRGGSLVRGEREEDAGRSKKDVVRCAVWVAIEECRASRSVDGRAILLERRNRFHMAERSGIEMRWSSSQESETVAKASFGRRGWIAPLLQKVELSSGRGLEAVPLCYSRTTSPRLVEDWLHHSHCDLMVSCPSASISVVRCLKLTKFSGLIAHRRTSKEQI